MADVTRDDNRSGRVPEGRLVPSVNGGGCGAKWLKVAITAVSAILLCIATASAEIGGELADAVAAPVPAEAAPPSGSVSLRPFGANLFDGHALAPNDGLGNSNRALVAGDRLAIRIWGAATYDTVAMIEPDGTVFVPEVGPVKVAGTTTASAEAAVRQRLGEVFTSGIFVHVSAVDLRPISVFVTGSVRLPGRYTGMSTDSILDYLRRAGGIDLTRGSFRRIEVRRGGTTTRVDLYGFLVEGTLPRIAFAEGDTVFVAPRGGTVAVEGEARQSALYEASRTTMSGAELVTRAVPQPGSTHATLTTTKGGDRIAIDVTLDQLRTLQLRDGDRVVFRSDLRDDTIKVAVEGATTGKSLYTVERDATLAELLAYVAVDPKLAATDAVQIRRPQIAEQQKQAIAASLDRLEASVMTARSASTGEAEIRVKEAEMISAFAERARQVQPRGILVVMRDGALQDTRLRDGDVVVVPERTDVVMINGEVLAPQALLWRQGMEISDLVAASGGFTENADRSRFVVVHPDGSNSVMGDGPVRPGDQAFVLPKPDVKTFQMAKDIVEILYRLVVSTALTLPLL
jgi:protein involved in polysaccharide export with SLBB domain